MPPDDELRTILQRLELTVNTLSNTVDALKATVDKNVTIEAFASVKRDVDSLLSLKDWVIRLVVGAVILALLGLILVQNGGPQ